jgi:hypothetical protein
MIPNCCLTGLMLFISSIRLICTDLLKKQFDLLSSCTSWLLKVRAENENDDTESEELDLICTDFYKN